ncbi:hypothetical protein Nepgr_002201 [Nepenthes gracilis]|uniref:Cyanobacterial aminoacyl-tRNA synthetase CAAD domain-containing protein n=1 Tax=Nepenthes gracilis TaxID=150966 RepID=A0AAD3RWN6_NEPGR|nr:hypothetical protein Nepgr_002201 [Nepenthes gracilis]
MAAAPSNSLSLPSSSALIDKRAPRHPAAAPPQCVTLQTLPPRPVQSRTRPSKTAGYCRRVARNVAAMATGEAPAVVTGEAPGEVETTETPEILKTVQEAWDKVEDKYAITTLVAAGVIALWVSTGMISAIDRLPLIPGFLELVGIGYTGWFAYQNLILKPAREDLLRKIKETYSEIMGKTLHFEIKHEELFSKELDMEHVAGVLPLADVAPQLMFECLTGEHPATCGGAESDGASLLASGAWPCSFVEF